MSDELKPCPFCGCEKIIVGAKPFDSHEHADMAWISVGICNRCLISGPTAYAATKEEAKALAGQRWNARAERTCRKVPGKMHYGQRRPKCSECGYGLGDDRWGWCPKCGAKIEVVG